MRFFSAALIHETNRFSPIPASRRSYEEYLFLDPSAAAPETRAAYLEKLNSTAPFSDFGRLARERGHQLEMGLVAAAEPSGPTIASDYRELRDQILRQLEQALPVDGVLLFLHGAQMAVGIDDCEGDILQRVRQIAGPRVPVGVLLDLHANLSAQMLEHATILLTCKEYPHTDFGDRAVELFDMVEAAAGGGIHPVTSRVQVPMMRPFRTNFAPFRRLLQEVEVREQLDGVLSISLVHGFRLSDTKDIAANVLVVTDAARELGDEIAVELGRAFFDLRLKMPEITRSIPEVLDEALRADRGPVVIAEPYDNPGGGFPGDSTAMLRALLDRGIDEVAVALLWDPLAVRFAVDAGEGARIPLRIGGKAGPSSGQPLDILADITCVRSDATQAGLGAGERWPIGESVAIHSQGIDIVLNTHRTQVMSPDCFTQHGIDPCEKRLLILKSAQHFRAHFDAIAAQTLYCSGASEPGGRTLDLPFANLPRPIWPLDDIDPDQITVWKGDGGR